MKNNLQSKTLIGIIREHVIAWRRAENWSRETVAGVIVELHQASNHSTGIVFEPQTKDAFEIREVNAQRIFRWLDDESKGGNLLPANFIPSILTAMPVERRLMCASEIMVSIGLGACLPCEGEDGELNINHIFEAQLEDIDAMQAATAAIQNPTAENLDVAERKLARSQKRKERLHKLIAGARKACALTKAAIGRVVHGKEAA